MADRSRTLAEAPSCDRVTGRKASLKCDVFVNLHGDCHGYTRVLKMCPKLLSCSFPMQARTSWVLIVSASIAPQLLSLFHGSDVQILLAVWSALQWLATCLGSAPK